MRKKFVVALVAARSLTVAGTGTVFAMDKVSAIASEKEHVHGDNCEWVVDKEAWQETIHHEAEYKTVHHEAEGYYEKQQVQVGTKPIYEKQKHAICQTCGGIDIGLYEDPVEGGLSKEYGEHIGYHADRGEFRITIKAKWVDVQVGEEPIYEEKDIWIETKPAWDLRDSGWEELSSWETAWPAYTENISAKTRIQLFTGIIRRIRCCIRCFTCWAVYSP